MDALIRQTIKDEMKRLRESTDDANDGNPRTATVTAGTAGAAGTARRQEVSTRLSSLLQRVRNGNKKQKCGSSSKEHRIQVRWLNYDRCTKTFCVVKHKHGGGKRYVTYSAAEPLTLDQLKEKASTLFFPNGEGTCGKLADMRVVICDPTENAIFEFPGQGTIDDYLKQEGLYPSATYLFYRTQHNDDACREFDDEPFSQESLDCDSASGSSTSGNNTSSIYGTRVVCKICHCSYLVGESCIRCEQNSDYSASLATDAGKNKGESKNEEPKEPESPDIPDPQPIMEEPKSPDPQPTLEELRTYRLSHLIGRSHSNDDDASPPETHDNYADHNNPAEPVTNEYDGSQPIATLFLHRSCICADLIKKFKDENIMKSKLSFVMINERGEMEAGSGSGVEREVFTLFWKEFSNSMTIGERERVPFVRHDHFLSEWEAIGRILVKGYTMLGYFPIFLAQAFMSFCLFGDVVSDSVFLDSFLKYLSSEEEDLARSCLASFPDNTEELDELLERFNCRASVNNTEALKRVLIELAKQELIQKPHVMLTCWQPILHELKQFQAFQTMAGVQSLYDEVKPTNKKVINALVAKPITDGERDALKFLQRYIRGLDNTKLLQFLRFTTASDILIHKQIEVTFIQCDGLSCRPISHTCGPLLELPSTYSNFVELRSQFNNILDKDNWEIDIV